jgi:hypothetical protein
MKKQYVISCQIVKNPSDRTLVQYVTKFLTPHCDLTTDHNLIKADCIFDSEELAQKAIIDYINKNLLYTYYSEKAIGATGDSWRTYHNICRRRWIRFCEQDAYTIVEYKPEFKYRKASKSCNLEWVKTKAYNKYCNMCGSVITTGNFFNIATSKICDFCCKKLGVIATEHIEEAKKENPNVEEEHDNSLFVECLE